MKLFLLAHMLMERSGLDWHIGISFDGEISGTLDDHDFCYNPELMTAEQFIADLAEIIIQAQVDGDEEEEE
ncbi:hypothetical protein [Proteiniclasticum sp. QWL-01]|uniref:hypothetical protein n=1 Tax=Proteiniclasticum sp. QWL-01 TaxID=3036945 RepID=UPI002410DD63|nr:hypothetical protein [Proteiniclasticum sp. QWL-01]WFF73984.1 hypothetical protein P6M73_05925 [Proteiniclasticum sp. QWL-01]